MTQLSDAEIAELERLKQKAPNAIRRLISGAFRRDGETLPDIRRPYFSIPASKDDDDLVATALVAALPALIAAAKAQRDDGWRAMESAPKGRKLLVGYYNDGGKWRTITATYYLPKTLDASDDNGDEDGFAPEGWYEESETYEEILRCQTPTHWRPLPAPPSPQETE